MVADFDLKDRLAADDALDRQKTQAPATIEPKLEKKKSFLQRLF